MRQRLLLGTFVLFTLTITVACSADGGAPQPPPTATQPLTPGAELSATVSPEPRPTGVKLVDDAISAVAAMDPNRLAALLHFWPHTCGRPALGPACPPGFELGATVSVIAISSGETFYLRFDQQEGLTKWVQDFVAGAKGVYAVLQAPAMGDPFGSIPWEYQIVFEPGMTLTVDDLGITAIRFDGLSPAALIASGTFGYNFEYLLKP